jgi:thiol-disulfide isomerase/thioredoxin
MINPSFLDKSTKSLGPIRDLTLSLHGPTIQSGPAWDSELHLVALSGRVIVLFVLGIDCGSCKYLAGVLTNIRDRYQPQVEVIGICVQTGCQEKLADFAETADVKFRLAYCRTRDLSPALGISASIWLFYPTIIFVDQKQRLRAVFVGGHNFFLEPGTNIGVVLDELLSESPEAKAKVEVGA